MDYFLSWHQQDLAESRAALAPLDVFSHTLEWAPSVNLGPKNYSISRSLNSGVM